MKTLLFSGLALLTAATLPAQILRPEAVNGAVLGGIAGAVIGHNSGDLHHNAWRGAALGAGAGLLLGSAIGESQDYRYGHRVPVPARPRTYVYREAPGYYSPAYYGSYGYGYPSETVYATPADDYGYGYESGYERPNYAGTGLLLGGLAGAIIGHNSGEFGHNAWRGAGYGATAGYILGAIAEHHARQREATLTQLAASPAAEVVADSTPASVAAPAAVAPAPVQPASPMASANRLFGRD